MRPQSSLCSRTSGRPNRKPDFTLSPRRFNLANMPILRCSHVAEISEPLLEKFTFLAFDLGSVAGADLAHDKCKKFFERGKLRALEALLHFFAYVRRQPQLPPRTQALARLRDGYGDFILH